MAQDGVAAGKPGGSVLIQAPASTHAEGWGGRMALQAGSALLPCIATGSHGAGSWELACGLGLVWGVSGLHELRPIGNGSQ